MIKRLMISLFAMGLIAIAGSEVNAGCTNIGGTQVCAKWITGSEICAVTMKGGGSCTPGVDCPVVTCSVFGRTDLGDGLCDPTTLDPECGLAGTSFCVNPDSKATNAQGNSFTLDQNVVQTLSNTFECRLKGSKCSASSAKLDISDAECPECCINPNWLLLTFTTPDFNASACVCPNGAETISGACCADSKRNPDGTCVGTTIAPTCINEHCKVDLTTYKPGTTLTYTCNPL
jgi:hypothetical protein